MRRLLLLALLLTSCDDGPLTRLTGALEVTAINAADRAARVNVQALHDASTQEGSAEVTPPGTVVLLERMDPTVWVVRVDARDVDSIPLQAVWIEGVTIRAQVVTELLVDLGQSPIPPPGEICNGADDDGDGDVDEVEDIALCAACEDGREVLRADDERCGSIVCDADRFELRGTTCVATTHSMADRCVRIGSCAEGSCTASESVIATAGECQAIVGCAEGTPTLEQLPNCPPIDPPEDDFGCADGEREGFLSPTKHPGIAGCSGGWSFPGVTLDLTPSCGSGAGDDSTNPEGIGCNAADLCAAGWHVCNGKIEVAAHVPDCSDAVPPGAPDKSLFFATRQSSVQGSSCTDDGIGDNDVFGCGNLGSLLGADKNCAPLDRVLASTQPNRCGFNEAEPPLGPWQCLGTSESHLHEGALVTKSACSNSDCNYDGHAVSTSDKGGILCCRD